VELAQSSAIGCDVEWHRFCFCGLMAKRAWVWVGALVCGISGCGGKAATDNGTPSSAGQASSLPAQGADDAPVASASAGAPALACGGGGSSESVGGGPSDDAAGTGGDAGGSGCTEPLAVASKALDVECPAELCAGTLAASDCAALPNGVIRTAEAACDEDQGAFRRVRALTFELSATRHKVCYYEMANFNALALLVGAQAWDDRASFCEGTASHVSVGVIPTAYCVNPTVTTLCDLQNPTRDPPANPAIVARACFNGATSSCEPCCDDAGGKHPDCTGKPQGYPGFECTPHMVGDDVTYCFCSCDTEQWICAC
jgi:hypothetical protein